MANSASQLDADHLCLGPLFGERDDASSETATCYNGLRLLHPPREGKAITLLADMIFSPAYV